MWIQKFSNQQLQQVGQYRNAFAQKGQALISKFATAKGTEKQALLTKISEMAQTVSTLDTALMYGGIPFALTFTPAQKKELDTMRVSLKSKAASLGLAIQRAGMIGNHQEAAQLSKSLNEASILIASIDEAIGPAVEKPVAKEMPVRLPRETFYGFARRTNQAQ